MERINNNTSETQSYMDIPNVHGWKSPGNPRESPVLFLDDVSAIYWPLAVGRYILYVLRVL